MGQYIKINPGDVYGCYTVIAQQPSSKRDEQYLVQCQCGNRCVIGKSRLKLKPTGCRACFGRNYSKKMMEKRKEHIGTVINGFRILDTVENSEKNTTASYLTECIICGERKVRTLANIKYKKGLRCAACPPDYDFSCENGIAIGRLANGTEFTIDMESIPLVNVFHWYVNGSGYLFHRDAKTRIPIRMHRLILGLTAEDGDVVVDHLNHNKLDNRKTNLRIVDQSANCCNNLLRITNTTGFVGVSANPDCHTFGSAIQKAGKEYRLLSEASIEEAAQAYNVAADYLFGVGIGHRNRVLYPGIDFSQMIIEKIRRIESKTRICVNQSDCLVG